MDIKITSVWCTTKNPTQSQFYLHTHNEYEIFCILSGNAQYSVEGNKYKLMPGDIMIMRKNEFHYLLLKSNEPYERIVVNFSVDAEMESNDLLAPFICRKAGERNHYRPSSLQYNHMLYYLKKLCKANTMQKKSCYLLPFLSELNEAFELDFNSQKPTKDKATHIINYINSHLEEDISLTGVSEDFFISSNHINRIIKETSGTTFWEYVTVKRLSLAREQIKSGRKPIEACFSSGFKDYATFFRSYKKHFGVSPKADKSPIPLTEIQN